MNWTNGIVNQRSIKMEEKKENNSSWFKDSNKELKKVDNYIKSILKKLTNF